LRAIPPRRRAHSRSPRCRPRTRAANAARRRRIRSRPPYRGTTPGRYLRRRREELHLELAALHERTKIRHRHLEAIEAERFDELPPEVIVSEYVRQIAQALDVADPVGHARMFVEKARACRDLPMPRAPRCERLAATRSAVSAAFARAMSRVASPRTAREVPERELPSAEALLADFDYEPEIEAFAADSER
jgi:hypothetical protein